MQARNQNSHHIALFKANMVKLLKELKHISELERINLLERLCNLELHESNGDFNRIVSNELIQIRDDLNNVIADNLKLTNQVVTFYKFLNEDKEGDNVCLLKFQ